VTAEARLAVCTLGGGKDAAHIADSFLGAMDELRRSGWTGVLITGPYMSSEDCERLSKHPAAQWLPIIPMVDDLPSYLAAADAVVCMGGYNTTCELLALAVPGVIIPRIEPRVEQQMRAERLSARGLVTWLHPNSLAASVLAERIERVAASSRSELAERLDTIARHGIRTAAQHLAALLPAATPPLRSDRRFAVGVDPAELIGATG
jgi:predicted glycosyltransferase